MENENILKSYASLGISSQRGLYDFMVKNKKAVVLGKKYNLSNSNEAMEFMAGFLTAFGFDVVRLYLTRNDGKKHYWFLAFTNGLKWFYYETNLKDIMDDYSFAHYDSLVTFAASKIIKSLEKIRDNDVKVLERYVLKEIKPLKGLGLSSDIKESDSGHELLIWGGFGNVDYDRIIKKAAKEVIKGRRESVHVLAFVLAFIITLFIGVLCVWLLANYYGNV